MKRAWSKMSRVISALLVLGMFASVVPAQALAVEEEESAAVVEQQDEEQTEVQEPLVEEQEAETQKIDDPTILSGKDTKKKGLYTIYNKSENVDVRYVYGFYWIVGQHWPVYDNGDIPAGGCFTTSEALDYAATLMVFFKVPDGYEAEVAFSKPYGGEPEEPVLPLDENFPTQPGSSKELAYDFTSEIEQAKLDGYTHGFYYTYWSPYVGETFSRWFDIDLTPIEYDITYEVDEDVELPEKENFPESYNVEDLAGEGITLGTPTRDGYEFLGWTLEGSDSAPAKPYVIKEGTTGELTFVAHWEAQPASIIFQDEEENILATLEGVTGGAVDSTQIPDTVRTGYNFDGWYNDKDEKVDTLPTTFPAGTTVYTGKWNIKTDLPYTINYYRDSVATENLLGQENGTATFNTTVKYDPAKYLPEGYVVTSGGQGELMIADAVDGEDINLVNVVNVVYTREIKQSYTVRYLEDGTGYEVASPKTVSDVTVGTTVTETAPDIAGYSLMSPNPQQWTIRNGENIITFYYRAVGPDQPAVVTPSETPAAVAPVTPVIPRTTTTTTVTTPTATPAPDAGDAEEEEEEAVEEEVIEEEETPLTEEPAEEETITDEETPLAESASGWALLNLILAVVTVIGAVVLVIGYFAGYQTIWRLLSLIPAIGGVVAFFLTEDMSLPMAFVDSWTVLMVIIAVVQVVIAIMAMKDKEDDEEA